MLMKNNSMIQTFAKGKVTDDQKQNKKNAVIYTRVSTKEQAETNQSLETQKKYCLQYALKHDLNILGFFGGTYESAKTDERNEFNRMIRFVKNQKEGVSMILVYSLDRFSRTGDNAIFISSELKRQGISIISVTQPIDVSTHSGVLQQNIQFIFSKYDNDLRREKCISGMKERLLRGEWTGGTPLGYSYDRSGGKGHQKVVPNEKGRLIAQGFEMKVKGLSSTEIAVTLNSLGLKVDKKRLSEIFRNPFYCGYLSHNLLNGEVIKGNHDALISEDTFYAANDMLKKNSSGYKQEAKNLNIPLKNFVKCSDCNTPLTGYIVKKKNLYYYKCNRIGCKCNRSAKCMHLLFSDLLKEYEFKPYLMAPLKEQFLHVCDALNDSSKEVEGGIQKGLSGLNIKLEKLEERFAYGEIDRDIFEKVAGKLRKEIQTLKDQLKGSSFELSNPEMLIDQSLEIITNLSDFWVSSDYDNKRKLQEVLFPGGIFYNKQIGNYRTSNVNSIIQLTRSFTSALMENKKGQAENTSDLSGLVVPTGIEPVLPE
jgi:site-specific DNA recombinase